jgi:hypothetical protein
MNGDTVMKLTLALSALISLTACAVADVSSGPKVGDKIPPLPVFAATGEFKDKTVDLAKERGDKPAVYVFVQAEHWGRPMFRFIKKLDEGIPEEVKDAAVVAVWLGEKPDDYKEYLPKISQYFSAAALTVFTGEKAGPKDWGINLDAHITVVVAAKGKVAAALGFQSVNDTDAPTIREALKNALK